MMRVRPLQDESDVRELLVAHGRAWKAAYDGLLPPAVIDRVAVEPPSPERVEDEYDRLAGYGADRVWVAADGGGTVRGYAVFRWGTDGTNPTVEPGEAELKELYVDPEYWGEGYGTALLEAGLERLPATVDAVALETLVGNEIAARFYESRGFERDGTGSFAVDGDRYPTWVYRRAV